MSIPCLTWTFAQKLIFMQSFNKKLKYKHKKNKINANESFLLGVMFCFFACFFNLVAAIDYIHAFYCFRYSIILNRCSATAKSLQSCPALCDPIDGSPPGSLEWVAISFSNA